MKGEIITIREALTRVGLAGLADESSDRGHVEWVGYPSPFGGGDIRVRGYGPLRGDTDEEREASKLSNDRDGSARLYQQPHKISQHFCGGDVLFCWGNVGGIARGTPFHLNSATVVSIDKLPDSNTSALRVSTAC